MNLELPIVCVVTRARGAAGSRERDTLLSRLRDAAAAGASMIQVRERHLDDRGLRTFLEQVLRAAEGSPCRVLVNDRIDMAIAAPTHGVHLKSDGVGVAEASRIVPDGMLIGQSVHSAAEAIAVDESGGCDYLLFGTVYPSSSKPEDHPVAGVPALREICTRVTLPVVAIGGITPARGRELARAGAAGAAAISFFTEAADMGAAVRALRDALTVNQGHV